MNINDEDQPINLEEIMNIDEKQFRKQMINWIESRDTNDLQLQMKKYLIENFNKTALGRELSTKNLNHKVPLNPFYIILNVLIAEYLYKENLHFSLSILSTEIPYKNILPNFEENRHYRFDVKQLNEILNTLGLHGNNQNTGELNKLIVKKYSKNNSYSFLQVLITQLIDKVNEKVENHKNVEASPSPQAVMPKKVKSDEDIKLNTSIELLHKNIQNLCKGLDQLEKETHDEHKMNSADLLSLKKDKINSLIRRLEKCTEHFERSLPKRLPAEYDVQIPESLPPQVHRKMEYEEWLKLFVDSPMGQKYVKKLEKYTNRIIEKEKRTFKKHFEEKLVKEKLKMEIEYKDRIAQFLLSQTENVKISEKRETLQHSNVKPFRTISTIEDNEKQRRMCREYLDLNVLQNRKIERLEDENIKKIIQNSRLSIEQLERESEYLFNSFKDYLRKGRIPSNFQKYDNMEDILEDLRVDEPLVETILPIDVSQIEKIIPCGVEKTPLAELIPEIDNQLLEPIDLSKFQNPFDKFHLIGQSRKIVD